MTKYCDVYSEQLRNNAYLQLEEHHGELVCKTAA
jgi:hypothetical protein